MRLLAGQRHLQPPQPLAVGDDADVLALGFEDRALLDMQFEIGAELLLADRLLALEADALELVAEAGTLRVLAVVSPALFEDTGKDTRGEHGGGEARPLLVGPVDHLDRVFRPDA